MDRSTIRFQTPEVRQPKKPTLYKLLWPKPHVPVAGVFLGGASDIFQAPYHWCAQSKRTLPCPGLPACRSWCGSGFGNVLKTYIPFLDTRTRLVHGLVLGEEAFRLFLEEWGADDLRGELFQAERQNGPQGLVVVKHKGPLIMKEGAVLRSAPDLRPTIQWIHGGSGFRYLKK